MKYARPVILVLSSLVLLHSSLIAQQKELTNEEIWKSNLFQPAYINGVNSMNDGKFYTSLKYTEQGAAVIKYSYKDAKFKEYLVGAQDLQLGEQQLEIEDYSFSADEKKMLIATGQEAIYRHSSKSNYYVYDLISKKVTPLTDFAKGKQSLATFSPNGMLVAFVRENNLYVKDLFADKEVQVTNDGKWNYIINGALDWVYEEEFGFDRGFYWSPGGTKIAYYRFDEERVKEFQMDMYGTLYPSQYKFKYPKAGEANSLVTIMVYDITSNSSRQCDLGAETDQYVPRIKWTANENILCLMRLNRAQNKLEFLTTNTAQDPKAGLVSKVIYTEKSDTYVEVNDNLIFLEDGKNFLWNSERDGYNHIYKFNMQGELVNQITKGTWDVVEFSGYDVKTKKIFYTSSEESPLERHLYSINLDGTGKKKLTERKGQNDPTFSKGFQYYINYHSDANTPYYITLHEASGKQVRLLESNKDLVAMLGSYKLPKKEFFDFTTPRGDKLNGWMIKPPNFDATKKYPVFMTCYNGPGINLVNNSWGGANFLWHMLLAQKGYIVACVDGRGTGFRGAEFKKCTYKQLGKLETEDQIEAAKYMASLSFVDGKRIGMQGWSYGGYMTALCMTKGADVFKAGIAVAPVTNWRYYDSIYTERYMLTPQDNASGYDDNSPINHVDKLQGPLLLVHGSADDNVHYQNTMEMITALVKANKQFDLFIYPDKNHRIAGGNTRLHLFTKMTNFLEQNL